MTSTIDDVLREIKKQYGEDAAIRLNEAPMEIPRVSTGIIGLDVATGGGVPYGRIIEIFGSESSGKTSLALQIAANAQKEGKAAFYIDMEQTVDPSLAELLGVDASQLVFAQPSSGNEALELCERAVKSGAFGVVIVDSVASLVPTQELDADMGDSLPGLQARLMSQACRKLNPEVNKSKTALIFINQTRESIGIAYGNPTVTAGGKALKFYATLRIDLSSSTAVKDGDEVVGKLIRAKVVKNKTAPPSKTATWEITYGVNYLRFNELVALGSDAKIIEKSGAWYSYKGAKLGQGRDKARQYLIDNPAVADEIEEAIRGYYGLV